MNSSQNGNVCAGRQEPSLVRRQIPFACLNTADSNFASRFEKIVSYLNRKSPIIGIVKQTPGDYNNYRYIALSDDVFGIAIYFAFVLATIDDPRDAWKSKDCFIQRIRTEMKIQAIAEGQCGLISGMLMVVEADHPSLVTVVDMLLKRVLDAHFNHADFLPADIQGAEKRLAQMEVSLQEKAKESWFFNKKQKEKLLSIIGRVQQAQQLLHNNRGQIAKIRKNIKAFEKSETCFDFDPNLFNEDVNNLGRLSSIYRQLEKSIPREYWNIS